MLVTYAGATDTVEQKTTSEQINVAIATDDTAKVYVDGKLVIKTSTLTLTQFTISSLSRVIALDIASVLVPIGFTIQMSNGIVSDASWKCVDAFDSNNWMNTHFDDRQWRSAVAFVQNKFVLINEANEKVLSGENWWVSTMPPLKSRIFCRKRLLD